MKFEPIAVIGQSCVLPGALNPDALWEAVVQGRDLTSRARPHEWGMSTESVLRGEFGQDERAFCDVGGYVRGFEEVFNPAGFKLAAGEVQTLDVANQWLLHAGREALRSAGVEDTGATGAVIGNLSFPTRAMTDYAARTWLGDTLANSVGLPEGDPRSRFMSGLPADLLAKGLGLGRSSYAIDAACASSLYAIKLACDQLHDGDARTMLAGAVCASDDLFLHVGFSSLNALSRSGMSRPFDASADGLLPATGAGLVVLKRLRDALEDKDSILGVIRGVGLSNDGRSGGFLAPAKEGQVRAMRAAYEMAAVDPKTISLLECHATGTLVGDRTEIESSAQIFETNHDLCVGSLKSNTGHLITAAGVAGLIKVLGAMRHGIKPPTLHVEEEIPALKGSPFRVVKRAEPWETKGLKRAGVSAFGFGGNNAHLIVEEFDPNTHASMLHDVVPSPRSKGEVGIVGVGGAVGDAPCMRSLAEGLTTPASSCSPRARPLAMQIPALRFPPVDMQAALPQQAYLLEATLESLSQLPGFNHERCGVFVGMGCDPRVARYGARWRLWEWAREWPHLSAAQVKELQDHIVPPLTSAGVLGTMPNIVANRLNAQLDCRRMSFSVSGEERSGLIALQIALRALRCGEIDTAIVGGVDFGSDPLHEQALRELGVQRVNGDAAVVLVLQREADALATGTPILATVHEATDAPVSTTNSLEERYGNAHAAHGLVTLITEALSSRESSTRDAVTIASQSLGGQSTRVSIQPHASASSFSLAPIVSESGPQLRMPPHGNPLVPGDFLPNSSAPLTPAPASEVPPMTERPPHASSELHQMAPAPWLPPVSQEHVPQSFSPQRQTSIPVPTLTQAGGAVQEVSSSVADVMRAHIATVVNVHQQFVEQQAEVQRQFLQTRSSGMGALSGNFSRPFVSTPVKVRVQPSLPLVVESQPVAVLPAPVGRPALKSPAREVPMEEAPLEKSRPGPQFNREQLMIHAGGKISEIYGPEFKGQDQYERQVRMPLPPLLLADRVTGIDAEPKSMDTGVIWTETDVSADGWYLHEGHMPAGVMIESGQADLMLISYLGIDFLNQGDRVYRLLGCELTYHGHLPKVGETLQFEIHADGHAQQGDIRLFFFHYDCVVNGEPRLTVSGGQAGFFSREELDESMGILWSPQEATPCANPRLMPPAVKGAPSSLSRAQLEAFARGELFGCFGEGFELGCTHTRTPRISGGDMLFLDEVTDLNFDGGPWGRGYLRATDSIDADDWFFDGHFKNDPCMPGTLMFEGCLQTMAIYMAGLGMTLDLDGWRFEPVPEETFSLRCRGQVLPTSREVVYEVFVEEAIDGPYPTLYADLLCTVDGLKAFHCKRMGLRLVPAWPLEQKLSLLGWSESERPAAVVGEHVFNHHSLLACAWGKPSAAFGPIYDVFDSPRRVARLPGPPYHFMSRIANIKGAIGEFSPGASVEVEFDIPADAWYFDENGAPTMPYCVLLEAALQPCGWLASYVGSALGTGEDLFFRNLDGTGVLKKELLPTSGRLITRATITDKSSFSGMIIETFKVECLMDGEVIYEMDTNFGFFPKAALAAQKGLPIPKADEGILEEQNTFEVDLKARPERYCESGLRLPTPFLSMIDRITGYWPEGGEFGLGRFRSEQDVNPDAWYFKAHFFQDPVQPGSLGIEAMLQVLQFAMIEMNLGEGMKSPRFEPIALDESLTWKYRGQVRPWNKRVFVVLDIEETTKDSSGAVAFAKASLWVDGLRIYEASHLGMRIVEDSGSAEVLSCDSDPWLNDHCPTWTVPVLPMMSMVDRIAGAASRAAPAKRVKRLSNVQVSRWIPIEGAVALKSECTVEGDRIQVSLFNDQGPIASGTVHAGDTWETPPKPWEALVGEPEESPYQSGALFHGPAFQLLESLVLGDAGSSAVLSADAPLIPHGALNQGLLDAATHGIPHDRLDLWCSELNADQVAYPALISEMEIFGEPIERGEVRCEVRFDGFFGSKRFPAFDVQLIAEERVWARFRLVEALFPKGPLGKAAPRDRQAFLKDRRYVPGVSLSRWEGERSTLSAEALAQTDWLGGTLRDVYDLHEEDGTLMSQIATKEAIAHRVGLHPSRVKRGLPLTRWSVELTEGEDHVEVNRLHESLNLDAVKSFWTEQFNRGPWPVEDIYYGLIERFVRRVVVEDPAKFEAISGRGILYLGNHQVGVESLLFSVIASALAGRPTVTLAKDEHRTSWLGNLIRHNFQYPEVTDPRLITYFDREDKASLPKIVSGLAKEMQHEGRGVMVHVEGTRSLSCETPVEKMSGIFIDLALKIGAPIVPVRFTGGLPRTPVKERLEFPAGMGRQDYWLGTPILPEELEGIPYGERKKRVIAAINGLGVRNEDEAPISGDFEFEGQVNRWAKERGVAPENAVLLKTLHQRGGGCDETRAVLTRASLKAYDAPKQEWLKHLSQWFWGARELT